MIKIKSKQRLKETNSWQATIVNIIDFINKYDITINKYIYIYKVIIKINYNI